MKAKYLVQTCFGGKVWRVVLDKDSDKTTAQIRLDQAWNLRPIIIDMGQADISQETVRAAILKALNYRADASVNFLIQEAWF